MLLEKPQQSESDNRLGSLILYDFRRPLVIKSHPRKSSPRSRQCGTKCPTPALGGHTGPAQGMKALQSLMKSATCAAWVGSRRATEAVGKSLDLSPVQKEG